MGQGQCCIGQDWYCIGQDRGCIGQDRGCMARIVYKGGQPCCKGGGRIYECMNKFRDVFHMLPWLWMCCLLECPPYIPSDQRQLAFHSALLLCSAPNGVVEGYLSLYSDIWLCTAKICAVLLCSGLQLQRPFAFCSSLLLCVAHFCSGKDGQVQRRCALQSANVRYIAKMCAAERQLALCVNFAVLRAGGDW